ncbi:MAG TPA: DUF6064 family protein [Skermanella sp.]|jgi:hypothetical protein|nr:DUF6064 family protein [Skermanella sp.]
MSEWWTYSLSDFLLFSPRTYYRLFELYNTDLWPAHVLALAAGLAILASMVRDGGRWRSAASLLLAACWVWVAWAFLLGRYATINWAATWFAGLFALQAVLLVLAGAGGGTAGSQPRPRRAGAITLLVFALAVYPLIGAAVGRPWTQAEVFAMAPDPTALGTLGFALLAPTAARRWLLLAVPLIWCIVSGATLWTMGTSEAPVLPAAGLVALIVAASRR